MISSRQKLILKAIIEIYVEEAQPVGSKQLTEKPYLNFSSATIRYDMAELEGLGFLEKTHTSSGRVPSEKGYRYYVENLVTRDQGVVDSFPLIDEIISRNSYSKEKAVKQAIKLISDLTSYTTVAIGPGGETSIIKKIDFIPVSDESAVILIVTDHGHVQSQNISIPSDMNMSDLSEVIKTLDDLLKNRTVYEASEKLKFEYASKEIEAVMNYQAQFINSFIEAFTRFTTDNFYLSGLTHVMDQPAFGDTSNIKNLLDMMDRRELGKVVAKAEGLSIKFSSDLGLMPLENVTVISIPYRVSENETGTIAVVGPNRMEYKKVIPLLEYLAITLGKLYKK